MSTLPDVPEPVQKVIEKVCGALAVRLLAPLGAPLVSGLRDELREQFYLRQMQLFTRAYEMVDASGLAVGQVEWRILFPLLEKAQWESDPDLSEMWAALLANAATSLLDDEEVSPSFPTILAQLSPREARVLNTLFVEQGRVAYPGDALDDRLANIDDHRYLRSFVESDVFNYLRLGLVYRPPASEPYIREPGTTVPSHPEFAFSLLGARFLAACQPPRMIRVVDPDWSGLVAQGPLVMWARLKKSGRGWKGTARALQQWPELSYHETTIGRLVLVFRDSGFPYSYDVSVTDPRGELEEAMARR